MLANTLVLVTSDNGASQEGGPLGYVNSAGPRNFRDESFAEKLARIDDIGGPKAHPNYPARLGHGGQHAFEALQAEHPRGRYSRSARYLLAAGYHAHVANCATSSPTLAT